MMHMRMRVLSSVVGMRMLVFEMLMVVCAMAVSMRHVSVAMSVRMGLGVRVLVGHPEVPFECRIGALSRARTSSRWCRGTPGPAC